MSYYNLKFKTKTVSVESVIEHLTKCSNAFVPPLHTYVDIVEYSHKIINNAITFEAWDDNLLIALVAAYMNDFKNKVCFITNVSVLPEYWRKGIAKKLLVSLAEYCKLNNFNKIRLEVYSINKSALSLYSQSGFSIIANNEDKLIFEKLIKNGV